ncbi:MAG: regulatory protein GemA [Alphaproteobacteria bacterium]|nr:regulatory protein GemA [Alphaproteobacteria bacterium]
MTKPTTDTRLRQTLAKVQIARKEMGLEEDDYRAIVRRVTGRDSAAKCSLGQLIDLVEEFRRLGWKGGARRRPTSKSPLVRKIFVMWRELAGAGKVTAGAAALKGFVKRMASVDDPDWLTAEQAVKIIEALKAMRDRPAPNAPAEVPP